MRLQGDVAPGHRAHRFAFTHAFRLATSTARTNRPNGFTDQSVQSGYSLHLANAGLSTLHRRSKLASPLHAEAITGSLGTDSMTRSNVTELLSPKAFGVLRDKVFR